MKKTIFILFLNFLFVFSYGQINTELIKKNVTENPKENFYPLMEKFLINPTELTQEQLNQLYYGSKFVKNEYTLGDYNRDYDKIWKRANKRLSYERANKILLEAEPKYQKNPLNRYVLKEMLSLYNAVGNKTKLEIVNAQLDLTEKTVLKSGDGKTEDNPICVIYPADVLVQLERFSYVDRNKFEQKSKQLSDGSILTMYKMGDEVYYVKLVGGYF